MKQTAVEDSRTRRLAFTLIELLFVLSIIAFLAAVLLPALSLAKAKARSVKCINNFRQWGLAYQQYADDNQDYLPRRGQGVQPLIQINRAEDWFNALPPYLRISTYEQSYANNHKFKTGAHSPFVCPNATDPGSNHFLSYAMNMNLCPWGNSGNFEPTKLGDVVRPAQVVAMADSPGPYCATYPSANPYSPVPRHNQRVNLLFLAGQVGSFTGQYIGCGSGDPERDDVRWLTGTDSDAGAGKY